MAIEQTLADVLYRNRSPLDQTLRKGLRDSLDVCLREAKRFVLTNDAAVKIGTAIHSYPEYLSHNSQFAIPPFETCWIELPARGFHNAVVPGSDNLIEMMGHTTYDARVGYLFHNGMVYVASITADEKQASFSPVAVELNRPSTFESELELTQALGVSRLALDQLYWGVAMSESVDKEIRRRFRAQHSIRLLHNDEVLRSVRRSGSGHELIRGCAGEVRNLVGILLMLNQPKHINYIGHRDNKRGMTHKGPKLFLGHSVIEIDLNRKPVNVLLSRPHGTHATPRLHEVMGHFAHRGRIKGCEHDWIAEDDHHWECSRCRGKRWWRAAHKRGDSTIGVMTQERRVLAGED